LMNFSWSTLTIIRDRCSIEATTMAVSSSTITAQASSQADGLIPRATLGQEIEHAY
jgi:hypothetical protein